MATSAGEGGATDPGHAEVVQRILSAASHYEVLSGVHHRSSDDEIKRAYRTLALKTHPDKNKHERAEEAFKRVHNAFLALETQDKRDMYHMNGGRGLRAPGEDDDEGMGGFGGFHGGFGHRAHDPFDFFNIFMGAAGGRRRGGGIDEIMMMMMLQQMLNGGGRGGFGRGGFGGFGGMHFYGGGGFDDDDDDDEYNEDEYYEDIDEEEEEEDPELAGVFFDQRRGVFICEGCDVVLKSEPALMRHIATDEHQHRFAYDEDDDDDDDENDDEEDDEADEGEIDEGDNSDEDYDVDVVDGLVFNTRDEVYVCRPCGVSLKRKAEMITHVNGKRHKTEMEKEDFHCDLCDVTTKTKDEKQKHLQGKKHLRQLRSPADATKKNGSSSASAKGTARAAASATPNAAPNTTRGKGRRN